MFSLSNLLLRHGYSLLFGYTLAVGLGSPLPADPLLLLMGAMIGNQQYSFFPALSLVVSAMVIGDVVWYEVGRFKGRRVLSLLCKLSLEPDTCVRETETRFGEHGARALLFAKFIPGMGLLSVSLAGISRLPYPVFLLADAAGCALWASSYLLVGRIFHREVDAVIAALGLFGRRAGVTVAALLALYVAAKYLQRKRFLRKLRLNRISPEETFKLIESGQPLTIVDLRHPAEVERDGMKIAGALLLRPSDLGERIGRIPKDNEIILYCT